MEDFLARYMPPDASEHGPRLDHLNALVHWLMLILFLAWGAYFVYVLFRFRARKNPKASYAGAQTHISSYSEIAVAVIEVVLLLGFSIPAWSRWSNQPPKDAHPQEIRVVAEQFAWNVQYPGPDGIFGKTDPALMSASNALGLDPKDPHGRDDVTTINDLHLEVNRPVVIHLTSKDVIHSFNLPVMRVKQDAIPGLDVPIHFTPVKTNFGPMKWEIACAQLCGLGHFRMRGMLNVQSRGDFEKWMKDNAPAPAAVAAAPASPAPATATTAPVTAPAAEVVPPPATDTGH